MNIWQVEADFKARLAPLVTGLSIFGTFDDIDWTAENAPRVAIQTMYDGLDVPDEVRGDASKVGLRYLVHVWLRVKAATDTDRTNSANALTAAMRAATGWEFAPGRFTALAPGQRTGFDGHVLRVSIAFSVPVVATALQ